MGGGQRGCIYLIFIKGLQSVPCYSDRYVYTGKWFIYLAFFFRKGTFQNLWQCKILGFAKRVLKQTWSGAVHIMSSFILGDLNLYLTVVGLCELCKHLL